jgi:hypothetical protein
VSGQPTIGRIVLYRSKVGDGIDSPAIVLRTQDTTNLDVIERWGPEPGVVEGAGETGREHETVGRPAALVPVLSSPTHVDLLVHGLGKDYREYNVPLDATRDAEVPPGTWRWPPRD